VRIGTRISVLATGVVLLSLLSGCSSESSAASSLATTASDAAAAAQTVSYDLRLQLGNRMTSGLSTTALEDAMTQLQKADGTLTGSPQPTAIEKLATHTLKLVRQAEDATQDAQRSVDRHAASSTLSRIADRLHQISRSLSKIEKSAKAKS
jgi:hypothetical protein